MRSAGEISEQVHWQVQGSSRKILVPGVIYANFWENWNFYNNCPFLYWFCIDLSTCKTWVLGKLAKMNLSARWKLRAPGGPARHAPLPGIARTLDKWILMHLMSIDQGYFSSIIVLLLLWRYNWHLALKRAIMLERQFLHHNVHI